MKQAQRWAWVGFRRDVLDLWNADSDVEASHMKRTPMKMAEDTDYTLYASYKPYSKYGPYHSAVDEAAAKMDMAMGMVKRADEMMKEAGMMNNAKMMGESMMAKENMKRDMMDATMDADMMSTRTSHTKPA